jgi:hypothetical protein
MWMEKFYRLKKLHLIKLNLWGDEADRPNRGITLISKRIFCQKHREGIPEKGV